MNLKVVRYHDNLLYFAQNFRNIFVLWSTTQKKCWLQFELDCLFCDEINKMSVHPIVIRVYIQRSLALLRFDK